LLSQQAENRACLFEMFSQVVHQSVFWLPLSSSQRESAIDLLPKNPEQILA
jgi:hypothetical protein